LKPTVQVLKTKVNPDESIKDLLNFAAKLARRQYSVSKLADSNLYLIIRQVLTKNETGFEYSFLTAEAVPKIRSKP
jgi:hypothetical protein